MSLEAPVLVCFCHTDTSKIKVLRSIKPDEVWNDIIQEAYQRGEYPRFLTTEEEIGEYEFKVAQQSLIRRRLKEKHNDSL